MTGRETKVTQIQKQKIVRVTVASYDKAIQMQMRVAFPASDMLLIVDGLKLLLSHGQRLTDLEKERTKELFTNLVALMGG